MGCETSEVILSPDPSVLSGTSVSQVSATTSTHTSLDTDNSSKDKTGLGATSLAADPCECHHSSLMSVSAISLPISWGAKLSTPIHVTTCTHILNNLLSVQNFLLIIQSIGV